jgi:polyisoprenyl-phosphate glycosyltransferase
MDQLLSIILLSYNSGSKINEVYYSVRKHLEDAGIDFEFIIMDDASTDDSFGIGLALQKKEQNVRVYQLSKNCTSIYSIFAGLSVCKGACATAIPDDEQQPYGTLIEMYRLWQKGHKIIIPNRTVRQDPFLSRTFSLLFYKLINRLSDITYPPGGADLFFIDREVIDIINSRIKPINTYIVPELLRLGFDPYYLPYERPRSLNEKSRWTFKKKLRLARIIFYSSSSFPIRFISYTGIFFTFISFLLILFYVYTQLFGNKSFWGYYPPGWVSTIVFITFFSGLILFALGIIAEYIWRIYEEVKNRPEFIIRKNNKE